MPAVAITLHLALLSFAILVFVGCGASEQRRPMRDPATITYDEAAAIFYRAEAAALAHDETKLCELTRASLGCPDMLRNTGGWDAAPTTRSTIVDSYIVPNEDAGGGMTLQGGRMLIIEGVDGHGQSFRNEFLVSPYAEPGPLGSGIDAHQPLYWTGF